LIARHFLLAWSAPSGPDVDENDFTVKIGRRHLVAFEINRRKVGYTRTRLSCGDLDVICLYGTRRMIASGEHSNTQEE
jgi:hypothetical protein